MPNVARSNRIPSITAADIAFKRARPNYGLDYAKCATEELIAFRRERRGLKDEPNPKKCKKMTKKAKAEQAVENERSRVILDLEKMDRNATFRFMDLPPEMRNLVYVELLTRDKENYRQAFTDILRVSKQIYREVEGILVAENIISVELSFRYQQPRPRSYGYVHNRTASPERRTGEGVAVWGDFSADITEERMSYAYPRLNRLRKARSLDIELSTNTPIRTKGDTLTAFFDLIAKNFTKLTSLRIEFPNSLNLLLRPEFWGGNSQFSDQERLEEAVKLFGSLSVPPKSVTLELEGLDDDVSEAVWKKINETRDLGEAN